VLSLQHPRLVFAGVCGEGLFLGVWTSVDWAILRLMLR
jgi:hypothetical protein